VITLDRLDVSQLAEIIPAQRGHLAQLRRHQWWQVDTAVSDATHAIHRALRAGGWTSPQRQRLRQLDPGWPGNGPGSVAVEIAIYPDVIRLAAHSLRTLETSHRAGP
jgi:hypothetical protein